MSRRNVNNFRYADDTNLMAESEEKLKSLLLRMKEESEKLARNSTFKKLRSWHLIPSWKIEGEKVETVTGFIFLGSKITADGACSHESKRYFSPWKESYDKSRQHIKKQRYHFADKGLYFQSFSGSHEWM